MIGTTCVVLLCSTVASAGVAGEESEATPSPAIERLADVAINAVALDLAGTERYGIRMHASSGNGTGEITFKSHLTVRTRRAGGQIKLEDTWEIMGRRFDLAQHCWADANLTLQRCDFAAQRRDARQTAVMQVEGEQAIVTIGERRLEMRYPSGTVTQAALIRLIPLLPRTAGVAYTFPAYLEALDMRVKTPAEGEDYRIVCQGEEAIELEGVQTTCTRFSVITDRSVDFYVDGRSTLRKIVADSGDTEIVRLAPEVVGVQGSGFRNTEQATDSP